METEDRLRTWLLQGLDGDADTYQRFLRELGAHVRSFLRRRLVQRPDDVEDLVQETLLAVHHQRHTYRQDLPLTAWVHAIARYKLVDWLRARAPKEALTESFDDGAEAFLAGADDAAATARRDLDQLLSALPERQRLPIVHMKLEGLSVLETARLTGMTESAVKVGVHRGLKALAVLVKRSAA